MEDDNTNYNSKSIKRKRETSESEDKKLNVDLLSNEEFVISSEDSNSNSDNSDSQELKQQKSKKWLQIREKQKNYSNFNIYSNFLRQHLEEINQNNCDSNNLNFQTQNETFNRQNQTLISKNSKSDLENVKSDFEAGVIDQNNFINEIDIDNNGDCKILESLIGSKNGECKLFENLPRICEVLNNSREINTQKCKSDGTQNDSEDSDDKISSTVALSMPSLEPVQIFESSNFEKPDKNLNNFEPLNLSTKINKIWTLIPDKLKTNLIDLSVSDSDDDLIDVTPPIPKIDLTEENENFITEVIVISDDESESETCTDKSCLLHSKCLKPKAANQCLGLK